ncbi:hypothetical protein GGX14DRAFT_561511 [Mycena pura]|uniref:Uncharacterized protein n=1 Tax=Mycena pura TaxID=153505 RepID=A0AAD6YH38_9AGAR|nr:hypothetical protein GGX14DRAFT_561511 [Mycena pura]
MSSSISAHALRNPGKATQATTGKPKKKVLSSAEQATRKLALDKTRADKASIDARFADFHLLREQTIEKIQKEFPHRTDRFIRDNICSTAVTRKPRAPNLFNAYVSQISQQTGQGFEDAKAIARANMAQAGVEHVADLVSLEEAEALRKSLKDRTEEKQHGIRYINASNLTDCQQTVHQIQTIADNMHDRTGVRLLGFMSRGHPDDPSEPHFFSGGEGEDFCLETLKMGTVELVHRFESWAASKDKISRRTETVDTVRHDIVELTNSGLRTLLNDPKAKMKYKQYDYKIRYDKKAQIEGDIGGCEDGAPRNPAEITTIDELRRVREAWRSGVTRWVFLTPMQMEEVSQKITQLRARGPIGKRKKRSDTGNRRGPRAKGTKSVEFLDSDTESDGEKVDEEEEEEDQVDERAVSIPLTSLPAASAAPICAMSSTAIPATSSAPIPISATLIPAASLASISAELSGPVPALTAIESSAVASQKSMMSVLRPNQPAKGKKNSETLKRKALEVPRGDESGNVEEPPRKRKRQNASVAPPADVPVPDVDRPVPRRKSQRTNDGKTKMHEALEALRASDKRGNLKE